MRITSPYGADSYRAGGTWAICDECGGKFRLSELRKRWDKALVCRNDWEPRHPQESLRSIRDRVRVEGATRSEPADVFVTTPITQEDL